MFRRYYYELAFYQTKSKQVSTYERVAFNKCPEHCKQVKALRKKTLGDLVSYPRSVRGSYEKFNKGKDCRALRKLVTEQSNLMENQLLVLYTYILSRLAGYVDIFTTVVVDGPPPFYSFAVFFLVFSRGVGSQNAWKSAMKNLLCVSNPRKMGKQEWRFVCRAQCD